MAEKKHTVHYDVTAKDGTKAAFDSVKRSLHDVDGAVMGMKGSLAGLAAIGAAGLVLTKALGTLEAEEGLNKLSQKSGIAVESLSTLRYAADLSDVSMEELGKGLKKLSVNMLDTQAGTGDAKDAFKALGISVEDSRGKLKSSEDVMLEIARRFQGMEDGAGKTALAVKMFGRSGAELIPFLNQGADGIKRMQEEAEKLGMKLDKETAEAAEHFNDNMKSLKAASTGAAQAMVNPLLPALNEIAEALKRGAMEGGAFKGVLDALREATIQFMGGTNRAEIAAVNKEIETRTTLLVDAEQRIAKGALNQGQVEAQSQRLSSLYKRQRELTQLMEFDTPGGLNAGVTPPRRTEAPRLPGKGDKDKDGAKRLREAARIAKLQADEEERWAREASEAWNFVPKLQENERALERWQNMYPDKSFLGMTLADIEVWHKANLDGWQTMIEVGDVAMRLYAGFDEEGNKILGTVEEADDLWKSLGLTMSSAFEDAVLGGKKAREVLQGIGQDIARIILRKGVTEPLGNAVIKSIGESSFGEFVKGIFGGGKAEGGPVRRGVPYMVGEEGRELFVPSQSGTIVPNHQLGGGGAMTVNVSFNYALGLSPSIRAEVVSMMPQIRRDVIGAVHDARRRNVIPA